MTRTVASGPFLLVEQIALPDGVYRGKWRGTAVQMGVGSRVVTFEVEAAIAETTPVTVRITDGRAEVEAV